MDVVFIDGVKLETLIGDYIEGVEEIDTVEPVQEPFSRRTQKQHSNKSEMKELETRLADLEAEVGALRGELRLIRRKFRDVDPYGDTQRQAIEKVVSQMLDNQCYWKMIRFDPS